MQPVLLSPVFAADSNTLCIVGSASVPISTHTAVKDNQSTGEQVLLTGHTWATHHELLYFDGRRGTFTGPFDLADQPSLARVNVAATDQDLVLWTLTEPAAIYAASGRDAVIPSPQLSFYPIGGGVPRLTVESPESWPVNDEPTVFAPSGEIVRLVRGDLLELWSPRDGSRSKFQLEALRPGARPSAPTMQLVSGGLLFINAAACGIALLFDSVARTSEALIRYPIPRYASSTPSSKARLSADGASLFVLGGPDEGGLASYDVRTGRLLSSAPGSHMAGITTWGSDLLAAFSPSQRRVTVYSPDLHILGEIDLPLDVAEIY
jgi:hypothetical protein